MVLCRYKTEAQENRSFCFVCGTDSVSGKFAPIENNKAQVLLEVWKCNASGSTWSWGMKLDVFTLGILC